MRSCGKSEMERNQKRNYSLSDSAGIIEHLVCIDREVLACPEDSSMSSGNGISMVPTKSIMSVVAAGDTSRRTVDYQS